MTSIAKSSAWPLIVNKKMNVGDIVTGTAGTGQSLYNAHGSIAHVLTDGDVWVGIVRRIVSDRTGVVDCIVNSLKSGVLRGNVYFFFDSVTVVNDAEDSIEWTTNEVT